MKFRFSRFATSFILLTIATVGSAGEARAQELWMDFIDGENITLIPITDDQRATGRSEVTLWRVVVNAPEGRYWGLGLAWRGWRANSRADTLFVETLGESGVGEVVFPSEIFNGGVETALPFALGTGTDTLTIAFSISTAELPSITEAYENMPYFYLQDEFGNLDSEELYFMYATVATGTHEVITLSTPVIDLGTATESDFVAGSLPTQTIYVDIDPSTWALRAFPALWDVYPNPIPGSFEFRIYWPMTSFEEIGRNRLTQGSLAHSEPITLELTVRKNLDWEYDPPGSYASQLRLIAQHPGSFYWRQYAYADVLLEIEEILSLSLNTTNVDIGTANGPGYWAASEAFVLTSGGNVAYDITIRADNTHFLSASGMNDGVKPISDLEWSTGGAWTPLSTIPATVMNDVPPSAPAPTATVSIRANVTGSEPNDQYTAHFTFEVVAQ